MKKVLALTLAMVLALSLFAACGNKEVNDPEEPATRLPMNVTGGTEDSPTEYRLGDTIQYNGSSLVAYCKMSIEKETLVSIEAVDGGMNQTVSGITVPFAGSLRNHWEISSSGGVSVSEAGEHRLLPGEYIISFRLDEMPDIDGIAAGLGVTASGGFLIISEINEND